MAEKTKKLIFNGEFTPEEIADLVVEEMFKESTSPDVFTPKKKKN